MYFLILIYVTAKIHKHVSVCVVICMCIMRPHTVYSNIIQTRKEIKKESSAKTKHVK